MAEILDADVVDLNTLSYGSASKPDAITPNAATAGPSLTDKTRTNIAYMVIAILAVIIAAFLFKSLALGAVCGPGDDPSLCAANTAAYEIVDKSLQSVLTAIIGIVGTVIGFYFGEKSQS